MRFISDPRSIPDKNDDTLNCAGTRHSNTLFEGTYTLQSDYSKFGAVSIRDNENIKRGKDQFFNYDANYKFQYMVVAQFFLTLDAI